MRCICGMRMKQKSALIFQALKRLYTHKLSGLQTNIIEFPEKLKSWEKTAAIIPMTVCMTFAASLTFSLFPQLSVTCTPGSEEIKFFPLSTYGNIKLLLAYYAVTWAWSGQKIHCEPTDSLMNEHWSALARLCMWIKYFMNIYGDFDARIRNTRSSSTDLHISITWSPVLVRMMVFFSCVSLPG